MNHEETFENAHRSVKPGSIVPSYSYPNNAKIENDFLYLRDENGNIIDGKVTIGDRITVLKAIEEKRLALVQYPAGSKIKQGYVTNSSNVIKYFNQNKWVNRNERTDVYEDINMTKRIGSVDPNEKATLLYKHNNKDYIVYTTPAGTNSKSGYPKVNGGSGGGSGSEITPGDIVPGGRTYPANATIINDFLYLRDENGSQISGRTVSIGDEITVLDVGYGKQLALVQYPTPQGIRQGYVTNATNLINYHKPYTWFNGRTVEVVHSTPTSQDELGTLSPHEAATILYKVGKRTHVVYDTGKGVLTKSGYVDYEGGEGFPDTNIVIPTPSIPSGVTKTQYGTSGKGRPLNAYKIGNGSKALFVGFALHGFEDAWDNDGLSLVKIGNEMITRIGNKNNSNGLNGWTIYIAPCMNPDGVIVNGTNNGPGRCAVTSRVDMNRCFPYNFTPLTSPRYYTGNKPLGAIESQHLKAFIERIKGQSNYLGVVDCHGWLDFTQGNSNLGKHFGAEFGFTHKNTYSAGFFSSWANSLSNTEGVLLEYPMPSSHSDVINRDFMGKTYKSIMRIIGANTDGGGSGGGGNPDGNIVVGSKVKITGTHWATGQVIPDWVKNTTHTIGKIDGNRALLQEVTSWIYLDDIVLVDGGGNPDTENGEIIVGSKVKVTGTHWATGQVIPSWVKNEEYIVGKIEGDRALLEGITSWAYLKDLVLVSGGGSGGGSGSGDYDTNENYHRVLEVTTPYMRGADVKKVQAKLNKLNHNAGAEDGTYGNGTEASVRRFQSAKGLEVDGKVGPATWESLMNSSSGGGSGSDDDIKTRSEMEAMVRGVANAFGLTRVTNLHNGMEQFLVGTPKFLITIKTEIDWNMYTEASPGGLQLYSNGEFAIASGGDFSGELILPFKGDGRLPLAAKLFGGKVYVKVLTRNMIKAEFYHIYKDKGIVHNVCFSLIFHYKKLPDQQPVASNAIKDFEYANQRALTAFQVEAARVIAIGLGVAAVGGFVALVPGGVGAAVVAGKQAVTIIATAATQSKELAQKFTY